MKVYITKYWQTKGIIEAEVESCSTSQDMVKYDTWQFLHKPWWHETFEEAKAHAEKQRLKKIDATKKTLKKLETMTF